MKSMAPPGASGTMKCTGRLGQLSCASARDEVMVSVAAAPAMKSRRPIPVIPFSQCGVSLNRTPSSCEETSRIFRRAATQGASQNPPLRQKCKTAVALERDGGSFSVP
jgi:hypothetical protein